MDPCRCRARHAREPVRCADCALLPHTVAGCGDGDAARRDSARRRDRAQLWAGQGPLHRTVKAGGRVRARASLLSAEAHSGGRVLLKLNCTLEIEGETKPALVAELLCLLIGKGAAEA